VFKTACTDVCKNILYLNCIYNRLLEDEPSGSEHVDDTKNEKIKILILKNVHFVGLYYINIYYISSFTCSCLY